MFVVEISSKGAEILVRCEPWPVKFLVLNERCGVDRSSFRLLRLEVNARARAIAVDECGDVDLEIAYEQCRGSARGECR